MNCFAWSLGVERANKYAKRVAPAASQHDICVNDDSFVTWNGKHSLSNSAVDVEKHYEYKFELPTLKTAAALSSKNPYCKVFDLTSQTVWDNTRHDLEKNKVIIQKQYDRNLCKGMNVPIMDSTRSMGEERRVQQEQEKGKAQVQQMVHPGNEQE